MNEQELRMQGIIAELESQRSLLGTRACELFAAGVIKDQRIAELEAKIKELTPNEEQKTE